MVSGIFTSTSQEQIRARSEITAGEETRFHFNYTTLAPGILFGLILLVFPHSFFFARLQRYIFFRLCLE